MNLSSAFSYAQSNYKVILMVALALFIFAIIGYYATRGNNLTSKYKNISNNGDITHSPVDIYIFYATWCPHCKTALPKWQSFSDSVNGKVINGSLVTTHTIDCTNAEDPTVIHYLNEFDVKGFPTVKGVSNGTIVNFDTKINENTLTQFVEQLSV